MILDTARVSSSLKTESELRQTGKMVRFNLAHSGTKPHSQDTRVKFRSKQACTTAKEF